MNFIGETSRENSSTVAPNESGEIVVQGEADAAAPVLFLDVDGVLNTSRGLLMNYSPEDPTLYHVGDLLPEAEPDSITPLVIKL